MSGWSAPAAPDGAGSSAPIELGRVLGHRYEILQMLGEGGMGTVYKARDREVDRLVALKVIRPELAQNADALHRFKQELVLARQVTHRNVIRIFDLGEADGLKFITMEFIDGRDLKSLIREKGKFTPKEAVQIVVQVCKALEASHAEGVIHRDLKPQNIMFDEHGKVSVMDFGIARSMEVGGGMTQTGALVGTPEYMSPEQAKGQHLDARSDLFSLGIIFYELLTGYSPYKADTAMATLWKRTHEAARPPIELEPGIPGAVSDMVVKCLEIERGRRYQSVAEFAKDLEAWQAGTATSAATPMQRRLRKAAPFGKWLAAGAAVILLIALGITFRNKLTNKSTSSPVTTAAPVTLAILPFRNASGDPSLDWLGASLADMLSTDVGQSAHLHPVSSDRLRQVLHDLQIAPDATSDAATLRQITSLINADTVVSGQYAKFGDQIRIDASLRNLKQDRTVAFKTQAPGEKDLLAAVDDLAQKIRENLALSPQLVDELKAQSFKPSSKSLDAIRLYSQGVDLVGKGNNLEGLKRFQASTQADPEFALAYAKLGQTYANLGQDNEAEQASRKAVELAENLPVREKYEIDASHARIMKDYPKAIQAYENLAKASPDDTDVQFALGSIYQDTGEFQKARVHFAAVLKSDPQSIEGLWAMGVLEIKSGNPQGSFEYLNNALTLSIKNGNDEKKALILQNMGIAYRLMNKPEEALRNYQESLAIQRRIGHKRGVAASLNEMGQVYSLLGKPQLALASLNEAMQVRKEIGAKKEVGDTLIDLGNFYAGLDQHDKALQMYKESLQIQRDSGDESYQALCLNNIGGVYFTNGQYDDALTYFQQALELRQKLKVQGEIAETTYNLAETESRLGQYDQALSQYHRALDLFRSTDDKRNAAIDSYSMGTLFGIQGRYGAALSSKEDAVKAFQELQDRSSMMAEILSGYGGALADAGHWDDAQKTLGEALSLARELKAQALVAQTLNFQGDVAFYQGETKSARALYEQALRAASQSKDREKILESKIRLAKASAGEGHSGEAVSSLKALARESDSLGLKYLSVECSIDLAEAQVNAKDYSPAREELGRTLNQSEKLGLRTLLARTHYLLATVFRLTGDVSEASGHYREALRYLDEIEKDTGSDAVLKRSDLNVIYTESNRWSQGETK
ncbi:MAG: tetratricopeptide repeat protein [Candidatus Acidiferrales bacterium]|jgi:serine/threonine protein kinase/tetratricopeptide (TPR) repeat protein